jgi:hypothetical protein
VGDLFKGPQQSDEAKSRRVVRVPRFIVSEPVGLGTVVTRLTKAVGVSPCGGCSQRAARLDDWLEFGPSGKSFRR